MNTTLVIMAAGMGSRYGTTKQIEPVGTSGEILMEYSIYDAVSSGFDKIVFVIKENMEDEIKHLIGDTANKIAEVSYVIQKTDSLPDGREKPWGTAHAILCCERSIDTPFAVINADDYYGKTTFENLHNFLTKKQSGKGEYCMVGFQLSNTLSENGYVSRGLCDVTKDGYLKSVDELVHIEKKGNKIEYLGTEGVYSKISGKSVVSMNAWGFTTDIFSVLEKGFKTFLKDNKNDLSSVEYFLPSVVQIAIDEGLASVKVLQCDEKWYGITYKEDKETVVKALEEKVKNDVYPRDLWKKINDWDGEELN